MTKKLSPFSNEEIVSLTSKVPTPFYLYDEATIRKNCRAMNDAFSWAPSFKNHFAVKATPNPLIVKIMKEEGCGADCSSMAELLIAEAVGFKGEDILLTSNNTPIEEYRKVKQLGGLINFDDICHIDFVNEKIGLPDYVCFRYNPGPKRTGNLIIGNPSDAKFGVTSEQLSECFLKARKLGATRFALHTMVVSNCLDEDELVETGRMMFELAVELKTKHGIRLEMVDLGGGIGIPYKPEENPINLTSLGLRIKELYTEMIVPAGLDPLRLTYECGRYVTANAGVLVTRVVHQKDTYKRYVGVDACIANLMRPALYGSYHHIDVIRDDDPNSLKRLPSNRCIFKDQTPDQLLPVDVVGGLCENNDKLAVDRPLPADIRIGDILVFHDTGAHGHAMGSNYNGKLRSAEYLKKDGKAKCCAKFLSYSEVDDNVIEIRRAETYADLLRTAKWCGTLPGKRLLDCQFIRGSIGLISGLFIGLIAFKYVAICQRK